MINSSVIHLTVLPIVWQKSFSFYRLTILSKASKLQQPALGQAEEPSVNVIDLAWMDMNHVLCQLMKKMQLKLDLYKHHSTSTGLIPMC